MLEILSSSHEHERLPSGNGLLTLLYCDQLCRGRAIRFGDVAAIRKPASTNRQGTSADSSPLSDAENRSTPSPRGRRHNVLHPVMACRALSEPAHNQRNLALGHGRD